MDEAVLHRSGGKVYFYDNFKVWTGFNFKDEAATEIYEIRYYFFPPGFSSPTSASLSKVLLPGH